MILVSCVSSLHNNYQLLDQKGVCMFFYMQHDTTGYNQSVTGCGSQLKHVVVTQRKLM